MDSMTISANTHMSRALENDIPCYKISPKQDKCSWNTDHVQDSKQSLMVLLQQMGATSVRWKLFHFPDPAAGRGTFFLIFVVSI